MDTVEHCINSTFEHAATSGKSLVEELWRDKLPAGSNFSDLVRTAVQYQNFKNLISQYLRDLLDFILAAPPTTVIKANPAEPIWLRLNSNRLFVDLKRTVTSRCLHLRNESTETQILISQLVQTGLPLTVVNSPHYCDIWHSPDETRYLILSNCTSNDGSTIWALNITDGIMCHVAVQQLRYKAGFGFDETIDLLEKRAMDGCADSMWWLGWANEGTNHAKSVWYYIAALRANPQKHSWAFQRIRSDAYSAYMCAGVPKPCLKFMEHIVEFQTGRLSPDWAGAIEFAKSAVHNRRTDS